MHLTNCKTCNKEIASKAKACPNCGAPQNKSKFWRGALAVSATLAICSAMSMKAETATDVKTSDSTISTPFCDSAEGIQFTKDAFANGPLSQALNLSIEDIKDAKQATGSLANPVRHCSGLAITNSGSREPIYYTFEPSTDGLIVQVSKAPPLCDSQIVLHSLYMQLEAEWATNNSDWTLRDPTNVKAVSFVIRDGLLTRNCSADMMIHTAQSDRPLGKPFYYSVEMRNGSAPTIDFMLPILDKK